MEFPFYHVYEYLSTLTEYPKRFEKDFKVRLGFIDIVEGVPHDYNDVECFGREVVLSASA